MKKNLLIIVLIFALISTFSCPWFCTEAFADSDEELFEDEALRSSSGSCGANLTWTLDDNGVLTISGEGAMNDYAAIPTAPWYPDRQTIVKVVIGSGVTRIGDSSFSGCGNLTSVTIPNSVTSIGRNAFVSCSSLTGITIPRSVTNIGEGAFAGCSSLTSITIPNSVVSLERCTFQDCSGLTRVTIPSSVTSIGRQAFQNCSSLKTITIPGSVISIGGTAFDGCSSLTSVTIQEGVTSIGESAFAHCSSLKTITIPGSVTSIGTNAFFYCSNLASITIPNSVTSIGGGAFRLCTSLKSVVIPEGVTSIEGGLFMQCSGLTSVTIPDSVTSIGGSAFDGCSNLTNITIPDGVVSIGGGAFQNCCSLTSIRIPEGVTSIGNFTFEGCSRLASINIPEGVTSIGEYAFRNCSSLTSIEIPEGVTTIENYTFYGCSSLTSITIPEGLTSIGDVAFRDCRSLTSFNIPDGVTSIGIQAFLNCSSLTSITIPEGVTTIEKNTFYGCSGLTSITLPASVTSIGESAFVSCNNVQYIFYGGTEEQWASLTNKPSKGIVHYESTGHTCAYVQEIIATCTEDGYAVWHCIYCDYSDHAMDDMVVPALGHDWGEPTYTWAEDYSTVTAVRVCQNDETHEETETVNTTSAVTTPATCEGMGETTYTAVFTNSAFETQTKTVANIAALGHDYRPTGWLIPPDCMDFPKLTLGCRNDSSHTVTVPAEMEYMEEPPTCESEGYYYYYCTATYKGVTYSTNSPPVDFIPMIPHEYEPTEWNWASDYSIVEVLLACAYNAEHTEVMETIPEREDVEPTCTEDGYTLYTATIVVDETGEEYSDSKTIPGSPALGHDWNTEPTVDIDPTCTEDGSQSIHCSRCDSVIDVEAIPALGHDWGDWTVTTEPGCETEGEETRVCSHDDSHIETRPVAATGHLHLTATEAVSPTCDTAGNTAYWTCEDCGKIFSDAEATNVITLADTVIPATGHVHLTATEAVSPTCETAGNTAYWTCDDCGKLFSDSGATTVIALADTAIPATGHVHLTATEAVSPTCETAGNTAYWTCEDCGKVFSDAGATTVITLADTVIPATGHVHLTATGAVSPTCETAGNTAYWTCEDCGKVFSDAEATAVITLADTVIPATGHVHLTATEATSPTCESAGNTAYWTCEDCGKIFSDAAATAVITLADTVIPATGHVHLSATEAHPATCSAAGNIAYWTCDACGKLFADAEGTTVITAEDTVIPINPEAHAWGDWVVTVEPKCETEGEETRVCTYDNSHFETRPIAAIGHDWDEGVVIKEPTYWEEGLKLYTCLHDPTHTYTEVIPMLEKPSENEMIRIYGSNRSATAIEAANHLKEKNGIDKFDSIIIASGTGFPDALSASYLAYKKDGPILLVDKSSITTVSDYVNKNLAEGGTVYIVGGEGAVPLTVDENIAAAHGSDTVVRLAGSDRFATNMMVLDEAGIDGEDLLVASGTGFADALSASAAKKPILLVGKSLSSAQIIYLNNNAGKLTGQYYVIGGTGAVSADIESVIGSYGNVKRLSGNDRFATSVAVANEFFPGNVSTVVIANGANFPDGLSGGPIAAAYDAPLVLVVDKTYAHAVSLFKNKGSFRLIIMGGTGVIADATAEQIAYQ